MNVFIVFKSFNKIFITRNFCGVKGYLDDIDLKDVSEFENKIINKCKSDKPEIIEAIQSTGKLDEDKEKLLVEVITQLKETFKS